MKSIRISLGHNFKVGDWVRFYDTDEDEAPRKMLVVDFDYGNGKDIVVSYKNSINKVIEETVNCGNLKLC